MFQMAVEVSLYFGVEKATCFKWAMEVSLCFGVEKATCCNWAMEVSLCFGVEKATCSMESGKGSSSPRDNGTGIPGQSKSKNDTYIRKRWNSKFERNLCIRRREIRLAMYAASEVPPCPAWNERLRSLSTPSATAGWASVCAWVCGV